VTFVSECEKKALLRTRRVLDAFANRIGSRTWQTVITEEGLQAVKKLLRKTATKNTAVSCHWLHSNSRNRSELLWVVGNQDKFNSQGIVPVNYTDKELIMDRIAVKTESFYANTPQQQPLAEHLFAVGYLAYSLVKRMVDDDKLAKAVYVAGCLHDIGKIDSGFQNWLIEKTNKANKAKKKQTESTELPEDGQHIDDKTGKFSFENHPAHNEISLLLYHLLNDEGFKKINEKNKDRIKHTLYWHHAKPFRKAEFKKMDVIYKKLINNIGDTEFSNLLQIFFQHIKVINELATDYCADDFLTIEGLSKKIDDDKIYKLGKEDLPYYKDYSPDDTVEYYLKNINENASNNIARSAVITADRLISALSKEELTARIKDKTLTELLNSRLRINSDLRLEIKKCLVGFENLLDANNYRNQEQAKAAEALTELNENNDKENVKVLQGPAGCGKTKIALEWAAKTNAQQILWICPRVLICEGLLNDLKSQAYLFNSKIEIYTGEFKDLYQAGKKLERVDGDIFSGDIVITTIDQIMNSITTHKQIESFVNYMNAHIVFDEYHEYINMSGFNLLFAELVKCKDMQKQQAKALLVSATPNYYFVKEFLKIPENNIVTVPSFNTSRYQIEFKTFDEKEVDKNPFYEIQPPQSFVISNNILTAQKGFIIHQQNEKALLLHSKFKKSDKENLFDKTLKCFGQNGSKKYDLLRSAPIVQAALNITCMRMLSEFTYAENWLQRLGRLDRFSENKDVNLYICAITENVKNGKTLGLSAYTLNQENSLQSAKQWYEFLQDKVDSPVTITEIYQFYLDFYNNDSCLEAIKQDFIKALKESALLIERKILDPVRTPQKKETEVKKVKIKKSSLRGDSRFVQLAVCKINSLNDVVMENNYSCYPDDNSEDLSSIFTMSLDEMQGYDPEGDKNLISFMYQKHHKILSVKTGEKHKQEYNTYQLKKLATEAESPIFLSYTEEDLNLCDDKPHPDAIYYAMGINNEPIGAISINKLKQSDE
jgi:CRISPR-associated endonuclease/helicase Cas3